MKQDDWRELLRLTTLSTLSTKKPPKTCTRWPGWRRRIVSSRRSSLGENAAAMDHIELDDGNFGRLRGGPIRRDPARDHRSGHFHARHRRGRRERRHTDGNSYYSRDCTGRTRIFFRLEGCSKASLGQCLYRP